SAPDSRLTSNRSRLNSAALRPRKSRRSAPDSASPGASGGRAVGLEEGDLVPAQAEGAEASAWARRRGDVRVEEGDLVQAQGQGGEARARGVAVRADDAGRAQAVDLEEGDLVRQ